MLPRHLRLWLASMVFVGLVVACLSALGAEGDWLDEAAALIERFEKVSTGPVPPLVRQEEYLELLDEVGKFSQAPGPEERERKGRKAFALLLSGRIHEQLGNGLAAVRCWQAHRQERDALPEADRAALAPLFEGAERAAELDAPRVCQVEARGNEVRVRAVDYPIEALLEKLSEATGEKIKYEPPSGALLERMEKAMGEKLRIQPELSGLVDLIQDDWRRVDHLLGLISGHVGLYTSQEEDGLHVGIDDPLYMASLGERAAKLPPRPEPRSAEEGMQSGYLIFRGHYVAPPYNVELRIEEDRARVYINGLPAGKGYDLKETVRRPKEPPTLPESGQFSNRSDLSDYAVAQFRKDRELLGEEEAWNRLQAFLEGQEMVAEVRIYKEQKRFWVVLRNGMQGGADVGSPSRGTAGALPGDPEEFRERAMAKARTLKESVENAFRTNGLALVYEEWGTRCWPGMEGRQRLLAVCHAMQEAVRCKEELPNAVFGVPTFQQSDWTWQIFLNLRYREVWQRLRQELAAQR